MFIGGEIPQKRCQPQCKYLFVRYRRPLLILKKVVSLCIICTRKTGLIEPIRIARLKLSFIAAKITDHSNAYEMKYSSEHDSRVSGLFRFMRYLAERIQQVRPWLDTRRWLSRYFSALEKKQIAFSS